MAESLQQMTVYAGKSFDIRLEVTALTGYVWKAEEYPQGITFLDQSHEDLQGRDGGRVQKFRFRAMQPGYYHLGFLLKRAWQSEAIQRHRVVVTVLK